MCIHSHTQTTGGSWEEEGERDRDGLRKCVREREWERKRMQISKKWELAPAVSELPSILIPLRIHFCNELGGSLSLSFSLSPLSLSLIYIYIQLHPQCYSFSPQYPLPTQSASIYLSFSLTCTRSNMFSKRVGKFTIFFTLSKSFSLYSGNLSLRTCMTK